MKTRMCIWSIILVLLIHVYPTHSRRKNKHPPVVAFFQGQCQHNLCDQKCRDIDNGGYACECYVGYQLNHDGISCSKISTGGKGDENTVDMERPVNIKIISIAGDVAHAENMHNSDPKQGVTFGTSILHAVTIPDSEGEGFNISEKDVRIGAAVISAEDKEATDVNENSQRNYNKNNDKKNDRNIILLRNDSNSIRIVTYDQTHEAPSLETDSLSITDSKRNKNLHNLVPNPLPIYSTNDYRKSEAVNQTSNVKCDEFSCVKNGKCVDDGTIYRNKVRCDCPLGTLGEKCEREVEVRYPRFYGNSYLALPVLTSGYKELDIVMEFKPSHTFGLMFFSAEFENARSDFFALLLNDGFMEFRYDCGTGMGVIKSRFQVLLNAWNTVRIHREDSLAMMWLNGEKASLGSSQGSYSRMTLRLHLYVGGYDNLDWIRDKIGDMKGFVGCVEQVIVNGYRYDLRKAGLVGDAQFGANVGECSEGLCTEIMCQHEAKCESVSASSHVCLCPLGTRGENCQHAIDVHIPEFQGHSYLEFQGLGRTALLFIEMEIVVKPLTADGLVLYDGYTLDRQGDFISLALHGGYLEFRFDLGTGPAIIRTNEAIQLNQWHWIKIARTGMEGMMWVDDRSPVTGQSQGAFTQLSVTQNLFIGGHRNFDETSKHSNVSRSFQGCIQKVIINGHVIQLMKDALSGVNVESCGHPCVGQPCLNAGQCVPRKDVYSCYCPLGYTGNNCHTKIDMDIATPRFTSESYLMYSHKSISKRIGGDKIDIRFSLKPESRNGLLFWSGPDVMLATSDYIAAGFKDGTLQFRYNLGSGEAIILYNNSLLFDGHWHYVHMQRDKQDGFIEVDGKDIVEGSSQGSYTMLNTNKILYIGGMPDVSQGTLRKFTSGYVGCLQSLTLSNETSLKFLQAADSGRNIVPCL